MSKATYNDDGKLLRVLKYLRFTPGIGLGLDGKERTALEMFADSSHPVHDDAKGHSGAIARISNTSAYASSYLRG